MAGRIQINHALFQQALLPGQHAMPGAPYFIMEGSIYVPASGRKPRPGDAVYYNETQEPVGVSHECGAPIGGAGHRHVGQEHADHELGGHSVGIEQQPIRRVRRQPDRQDRVGGNLRGHAGRGHGGVRAARVAGGLQVGSADQADRHREHPRESGGGAQGRRRRRHCAGHDRNGEGHLGWLTSSGGIPPTTSTSERSGAPACTTRTGRRCSGAGWPTTSMPWARRRPERGFPSDLGVGAGQSQHTEACRGERAGGDVPDQQRPGDPRAVPGGRLPRRDAGVRLHPGARRCRRERPATCTAWSTSTERATSSRRTAPTRRPPRRRCGRSRCLSATPASPANGRSKTCGRRCSAASRWTARRSTRLRAAP